MVTLPYRNVFVIHEVPEDGYYYVPMNVRTEMTAYAEKFDLVVQNYRDSFLKDN